MLTQNLPRPTKYSRPLLPNFSNRMEKIKTLESQVDQIKHPPPNPNGVYQENGMVGVARGVAINGNTYTFDEITNARQFNTQNVFTYKGVRLRVVSIIGRSGSVAGRNEDGLIFTGVTAVVVGN
jgi:hypothetical protein